MDERKTPQHRRYKMNKIMTITLVLLLNACSQGLGTEEHPDDATSIATLSFELLPATITLPTNPVCGNGIREGWEECDGDTFVTRNYCADYGFTAGIVVCNACLIDISGCTLCGDGVAEGNEVCDLGDLRTGATAHVMTCEDFGHTGGNLACNDSCNGYDESGCTD
jgi:hypothetical protein